MPRSLITEFRVGLFVSTGLLLAMITIFMIGSENRFFERFYTLYANFETISGLRAGATVQLAGIKAGFVDGILLPADIEKKEITVVLRVRKQFQDRIRGDSVATVETQGLLGDKYIYVTMGSEAQPVLPDKGLIPSKETASIFALADKAGKIMDDIGKYLANMNKYEFLKLIKKYRPWLTTDEAAARVGYKKRAFESWRAVGKGPQYAQTGKFIHYHVDALDAWMMTKVQPNGGSSGHSVT